MFGDSCRGGEYTIIALQYILYNFNSRLISSKSLFLVEAVKVIPKIITSISAFSQVRQLESIGMYNLLLQGLQKNEAYWQTVPLLHNGIA
jgi:hypothetical protein